MELAGLLKHVDSQQWVKCPGLLWQAKCVAGQQWVELAGQQCLLKYPEEQKHAERSVSYADEQRWVNEAEERQWVNEAKGRR